MNITNTILVFTLILILSACNAITKNDYNPSIILSAKEQASFKYDIARYVCKLPKFASNENKFDHRFDSDYKEQADLINLDKYYKTSNDTIYFEVSKIAPSFKFKFTATGGKLFKDSIGNIVFYEEIYRTWKMEEDVLKEKTQILFTKMIKNHDLTPFYTQNSGDEEFIEFPDQKTVFNTQNRSWEIITP